jgi:hypothetical protein
MKSVFKLICGLLFIVYLLSCTTNNYYYTMESKKVGEVPLIDIEQFLNAAPTVEVCKDLYKEQICPLDKPLDMKERN